MVDFTGVFYMLEVLGGMECSLIVLSSALLFVYRMVLWSDSAAFAIENVKPPGNLASRSSRLWIDVHVLCFS